MARVVELLGGGDLPAPDRADDLGAVYQIAVLRDALGAPGGECIVTLTVLD